MTSYRRAYQPGGTFFFTVVTHRRRQILCEPLARTLLRKSFSRVRKRWPFRIDAIVLLPDHLHCIWTLPPGDTEYSIRWNQIKGGFTKSWLAKGGKEALPGISRSKRRERGIWQRRLFEHCCRDEEDFVRCVDYVHINPLKHGHVHRVSDWPWSSFHRYLRMGEYSREWGNANEWFGDEWEKFE